MAENPWQRLNQPYRKLENPGEPEVELGMK